MPKDQQREPSGREAVQQLISMLQLEESTHQGKSKNGDERIFRGPVQKQAFWRVFGGQVLAQSAVAAMRTLPEERKIHSVHGYFLRPGDSKQPIDIGVDILRDGRSFSTRRSQAYQNEQPILSMIASFQQESPGPEHQIKAPQNLPEPEDLPGPEELVGHVDHPIIQEWAFGRPFDIRHIQQPIYMDADQVSQPTSAVWMKSRAPLPRDQNLHRAALLYASDYTLLEPVMRQHHLYWAKPGVKIASLDHAMWWHRDVWVDEWLLYVQQSPSSQNSRGLSTGYIYDRAGRLVATVAQEGMIRVPSGLKPKIQEKAQRAALRGSRHHKKLLNQYGPIWGSRYFNA